MLLTHLTSALLVFSGIVSGGQIIVTTVPDESHFLRPITSLNGIPLAESVEIRAGAFPGLTDDDLLNIAAEGGYSELMDSFIAFGSTTFIGDGVDGLGGNFEIALEQNVNGSESSFIGEEISIVILQDAGAEFMITRFKGKTFKADTDTGLRNQTSLHLADAKVIVGTRYGNQNISTSPAPSRGTFEKWINRFAIISDPLLRLPEADADGDGQSNYLEYATGGNPSSGSDPMPCQINTDATGEFWIRFSQVPGLGRISYQIESATTLESPWLFLEAPAVPDTDAPIQEEAVWMKVRVPTPLDSRRFFRLNAQAEVQP